MVHPSPTTTGNIERIHLTLRQTVALTQHGPSGPDREIWPLTRCLRHPTISLRRRRKNA